MLVIHGIWAYGAAQVWAEDSALPAQAPPRRGRPSRAPRPHPFAALPDELADAVADALAGAGLAGLPRKAVDDEITLRLPSAADGPLPSPGLVRLPAEGAAGTAVAVPAIRRPSLAAWRVPVLAFGPADAMLVLESLAGLMPGDTVADGSLGYLAAIARFAADLAARGRVIPALIEEDDGWAARWRPVLSAADARHARELAAAMPPACRALADGAADAAPGPLFADMLDALADASVRSRLPAALLPARRGRRPARIGVAERVVLSLTGSEPLVEVADAADERESRDLAAAFAAWLASAAFPAGESRASFRLVEPPAGEGGAGDCDAWRVEFSLQSAEDPSLMLLAADVWAGAGYGWLSGGLVANTRHPEEELLAGCYRSCFALVEPRGIKTVAFPSISTGAYGFPMERAAGIALRETKHFLEQDRSVEKVILVCFGARALEIHQAAFREICV